MMISHRLIRRMFLPALINRRKSNINNIFMRTLSSGEPYRNRYTHYREAYPVDTSPVYKFYASFVYIALIFFAAGGGLFLDEWQAKYFRKKQEEEEAEKKRKIITAKCQSDDEGDDASQTKEEKKRVGFRDRRFIAYEDRIRAYSTPDKIFRYFATLKSIDDDTIYMTPDDFLRSITPGVRQPEGLDLDSFKRYDPKGTKLDLNLPKSSIFYRLCNHALLTFTDFVFLLTVISTPRRQFELAFRMFDLNGDGELDVNEFEFVRSVITDTTAMGKRHRDHSTTGSTLQHKVNSALQTYFFGAKGDQKLTIENFLQFHTELLNEITQLEFNRMSPRAGKITAVQFSNYLLTYAGLSEQKRRKMIRRVKQAFGAEETSSGVSYKEFADFNQLLRSIADVDTALTFYHMAGAAIDKATLGHVALSVANVKLSPFVIDVVFTLFDENNDSQLSYREFVGVMRNRLLRGLDKPMDTGFVRFVDALCKCAKDQWHYGRSSHDVSVEPAG